MGGTSSTLTSNAFIGPTVTVINPTQTQVTIPVINVDTSSGTKLYNISIVPQPNLITNASGQYSYTGGSYRITLTTSGLRTSTNTATFATSDGLAPISIGASSFDISGSPFDTVIDDVVRISIGAGEYILSSGPTFRVSYPTVNIYNSGTLIFSQQYTGVYV
jgi:hypothetical protein